MAASKSHLACFFLAVAVLTAAAAPEPSLSAAVTARAPAPSPNGDLVAKPSSWSCAAPEPPKQGKCCDGLRSLVQDAPICLCRILEGTDLDKLMSATVDREKFIRTMIICDSSPGEFGSCEEPSSSYVIAALQKQDACAEAEDAVCQDPLASFLEESASS
ncbi:unnamed protein product [Triticum turgidum subsp. durum]|uniref:Bifunctional inhibitor/plant lipid transfer protein/seed storage helical domain-containing protein n=1 Tax=Triticum turgidum subsp. durum TaxID=4567 RepID=A0A9R1NHW1_TRITD|nr:unnamed protein product [Triticum turgidum subsp. durum]